LYSGGNLFGCLLAIGYSDWGFLVFFKSFQAKAGIVPSNRSNSLLRNPCLHTIHSPIYNFCGLKSKSQTTIREYILCIVQRDEKTIINGKSVWIRGCIQKFPDWVDKYTLTFGITRCCPLQSIPLQSLCNGSSVSATVESIAGSDFLESLVGRLAIVPAFQWHPGNDALLASISF
jgi:hypothetical protein